MARQRIPSPWQYLTSVPSQTKPGKEYKVELHRETFALRCGCIAQRISRTDCKHLKDLVELQVLPVAA